MTEIWKPVPGYDGYSVSNMGNVKGSRGKLLSIQKNRSVTLCKTGVSKGIYVIRLMYAAFNQVELSSLKGLVITGSSLNDMQVFDKNGFLKEMLKKKGALKANRDIDIDKYYADTLNDIHLIMKAQSTGDIAEVVFAINSKKENIVKYIYHYKYSTNKDTIEDAWSHARETCIMCIVKKSYAITNIASILKVIVRTYFITIRKEKRKISNYDDKSYLNGYMY